MRVILATPKLSEQQQDKIVFKHAVSRSEPLSKENTNTHFFEDISKNNSKPNQIKLKKNYQESGEHVLQSSCIKRETRKKKKKFVKLLNKGIYFIYL